VHTIDIRKASRSRAIDRASLERLGRRVVGKVLDGERLREAEVSILFVDDPAIRDLNRRYRRKDRPTDVLSFALAEPGQLRQPGAVLGDVVISIPAARRQAADLGHPLESELALLLVHGTLHLLGYDHESDRDARRMRTKTRRYLAVFGIRNFRLD
jgi:probable rRNA maturation factor